MILAVTGGTGFVGRRTIAIAVAAGHEVRALTRRPQPATPGVAWTQGALDTPAALARLVEGADAVLHIAGVVNAPDRAGFARGNVDGTRALIETAQAAGVDRFVHVSSLAAREPALSDYGWSKAESETLLAGASLDWTIVRPPAVYGPGDLEMLDTFRLAKAGVALTPPAGRMSVIHVDDLGALLVALAPPGVLPGAIVEPDDGRDGGWRHADFFGGAVGLSVGRRPVAIALPRPLLRLGARIDRLWRGDAAKLTADRVRYISHPDWTVDPARRPPPALWVPRIDTEDGLAQTAAWYRAQGLL